MKNRQRDRETKTGRETKTEREREREREREKGETDRLTCKTPSIKDKGKEENKTRRGGSSFGQGHCRREEEMRRLQQQKRRRQDTIGSSFSWMRVGV